MKIAIHQLYTNLNTEKVRHWIKLISITGGAQAIVQATSLLSGILIIRMLSVQEYAYYTIANTMLGTMTLISDGGISTGVMSLGGKVWEDKEKLGTILATGLKLKRKFAIVSLIVSGPILLYLLLRQGANWIQSIFIASTLVLAFWAAISDSILEIIPKLHQDTIPLQRNQLNVSVGRLILNVSMLFFAPWAFVAILSNGLPRVYGNICLKRFVNKFVNIAAFSNFVIEKEIINITKKILPASIYYSFSGQITILITSFLGQTITVAQIGALSRYSMIFNFFSVALGILFVPRFARLKENPDILLKFLFMTQGFVLLCSVIFIFFANLFAKELLYIIGQAYLPLKKELILSLFSSMINLLGGMSFAFYSNKGWIITPMVVILIDLIGVIFGTLTFDLTNLQGVLFFNIFTATLLFLVNEFFIICNILKLKK